MSESRADTPPLNWSDLGVSDLPTGTVTLLLADVEGSTRLWESQRDEMTAAFACLDHTLTDLLAAHSGVRPVEQGEGDSFVIAFARASEAVACALELQRAPLAPIRLRIGVHTGEVQLRDEGNYIGPTINRTARIRDLGHGGQTLLSGATEEMVFDRLPPDSWLTDLGSHELRGVARPERVVQLCHPDLHNEFPSLRTANSVENQALPAQLTRFVGRGTQIDDVRKLLRDNRFVTLTGAGGAGKTRLAIEIAGRIAADFPGGLYYVDLAPVTHSAVVPVAMGQALGMPDQPGSSTTQTLVRALGDRQILMLLDNCEHLLDATASLTSELLGACPNLTLFATSREPINVSGEVTFLVPSLSLADEAIELFADRARRVRPDFAVTDDNVEAVTEICRRLDGMPLAIELAAPRVRALSLDEIVGSLHDRFRLLTGGARTAVRRQQTLRASVDWSHALLTEPERILFRRLAVFLGGFDLDAAQAVAGSSEVERYQVLDQLALLVDKSLVVAENTRGRTRYRLLETVRQYALEKLGESGEADEVRGRHRDHYTSMAALLDAPAGSDYEQRIEQADEDIDNLRGAFGWSLETGDNEGALRLATSLQPLWIDRGRIREGVAWLQTATGDEDDLDVAPAVRVRAAADRTFLLGWSGVFGLTEEAEQALAMARELDDPGLVIRALIACGTVAAYAPEQAQAYYAEAVRLAREIGDYWRLGQILSITAIVAIGVGDIRVAEATAGEAVQAAAAIGDRFTVRQALWPEGWARLWKGDLAGSVVIFRKAVDETTAAHHQLVLLYCLVMQGFVLALLGDRSGARAASDAAIEMSADLVEYAEGISHATSAFAFLAAGDVSAACRAYEAARMHAGLGKHTAGIFGWAPLALLASGDVAEARRWADEVASTAQGCYRPVILTARARVELAQGEPEQARRDLYDALSCAADTGTIVGLPDTLESLAELAADTGSPEAGRLLGAADAIRQRTGEIRLQVHHADYEAWVTALRNSMGDEDFESAWAEGSALSTEEAIAYAQRGRGERKRPASGWASLTPAELDVVRLVGDGLANKDIATRLFISPRTVESHLSRVYSKLGLSSRLQLAQEFSAHR